MSDELGIRVVDLVPMLDTATNVALEDLKIMPEDIKVILVSEEGYDYKIQDVKFDKESGMIFIEFDHDNT